MTSSKKTFRLCMALLLGGIACASAGAQTSGYTSSGTLSVSLQNGSGLQMFLYTDPSGVTLGNSGSASATLGFGTVSAYGSLGSNITRVNGASSFTVSTPFDVNVQVSGVSSTSYTLKADLSAAAPTGVTIGIDTYTLTTTLQTISTTGAYGNNVQHSLSAVILTSGASGPATGTQLTSTINLTATAN